MGDKFLCVTDYDREMGYIRETLQEHAPIPGWKVLTSRDWPTRGEFFTATDFMRHIIVRCSINLYVGGHRQRLIAQRIYPILFLNAPDRTVFVKSSIIPDMAYQMSKRLFFGKEEQC